MNSGDVVLDRYVVDAVLGSGGMGMVLRARHITLGHLVAIKLMTVAHPEAAARFLFEARSMAAVRSPHVAAISDYGTHEGNPVMVMEYVEGESLAERLARTTCLTWPFAFKLAAEMAQGLAKIHASKILHRDIKPANVMLEKGSPERVKIVDFGIAKQVGPDAPKMTKTGIVIGTPAYMAPEQMMGLPLGPEADLYALGSTLYEMISGTVPFGDDFEETQARLVAPPPAPPVPVGLPALPRAATELICRLLEPDPKQRFHSAAAVARALSDGATPSTSATPVDAPQAQTGPSSQVANDGPFVMAARVPARALASRAEREWLASLLSPGSRGYSIGNLWIAVMPAESVGRRAEPAGNDGETREVVTSSALQSELARQLQARYGDLVGLLIRRAPRDFRLAPSALTGAGDLPQFLTDLMTSV